MIQSLSQLGTPPTSSPITPGGEGLRVPADVLEITKQMVASPENAQSLVGKLARATGVPIQEHLTRLDLFHNYIGVFVVAFLVAILATPIMRRLAIANGIVDRPDEVRKSHKFPIAYLGGVGVFLGIIAGIFFSYIGPRFGLMEFHPIKFQNLDTDGQTVRVPISIIGGMTIIMLVGMLDDVLNISPWQKVGGQLLAAALLATNDIGVKVATQLLVPIGTWLGNPSMKWDIPLPGGVHVPVDMVYWTGTAIIAIFIMGACNASNLIDGLDGLLSGVTAICVSGLLVVSLGLAVADVGPLDSARVVLCMAVIGGCLGFLPHNFNPAVIFLGDCGSLLLGYSTIVIILTLGDQGQTNLVLAGLVIYSIPIIDTSLAIIRRKLSGKRISDGDDQHLHHMLRRALGVKGAVLTLYVIGIAFACLGITLTMGKARVTYAITAFVLLFISVTAIKIARRKAFEEQAQQFLGPSPASDAASPTPGSAGHAAGGPPLSPATARSA